MNTVASQAYRILVPKFIRKKILARQLPIDIQRYYASLPESPSAEIQTALDYLKSHKLEVFPYPFQDEYLAENVQVFEDQQNGMKYVLLDGKKLYFKKRWGVKKIQNLYNLLSKEQDIRSPHRYLTDDFTFDEGDVLVDVGAAEGNFALSVVEKASKIILFEADQEWIEPLNATFAPWKDKVTIVKKYVSNLTDEKNARLDDTIETQSKPMFLKIDVEGAESRLLAGAGRIITGQNPIKVAICTYHKQNDEQEFNEYLLRNGFKTKPSDGYMLFFYDKKMKAPYFRRGLIRATRNLLQ